MKLKSSFKININKKLAILFLFLYISFNLSTFVYAEIVRCRQRPCSWQDFSDSLIELIRTTVIFSFWIAVVLSTIGAFLIMFHGPKPSLYNIGKNMIVIAISAYILILLSGVIFDLILEFFAPRVALAQTTSSSIFLDPLKNAITEGLRCGQDQTKALNKIFSCLFEAIGLLKTFAVILLTIAIIGSAAYLITTPLFGLENIKRAYQILIWSIIGLVVILLAEVIRDQIKKLTE